MIGRVVSAKAAKTITVKVSGKKTHRLYKKSYVWSKKYLVHDEIGAKLGDVVDIIATRPISKRKHFKVTKIVGKDVVALGEEAMKQKAEEAIAEVMPESPEESESQSRLNRDQSVSESEVKVEEPKEKVSKAEKVSRVSKGKTTKKQEIKGGKE